MKPAAGKFRFSILLAAILLCAFFSVNADSPAQKQPSPDTLRCTQAALRAMKPLPELAYPCEDRDQDSLKSPRRKRALRQQVDLLERFTSPAWWAADTDALNVCAAFKKPQVIARDEYISQGYPIAIYGDAQTRLVITSDPCVKYSYGTLNVFVLQRAGGRVVVTQVLDGYFSRADNAVGLRMADRGGERILEVWAGSGGLDPHSESYLFTIDTKTHRAVPKRLIQDGNRFTHKMTSCAALEIWANKYEFELSKDWEEMSIINRGKLADTFYVYADALDKLERNVFKWNGRYYALQVEPR